MSVFGDGIRWVLEISSPGYLRTIEIDWVQYIDVQTSSLD